MSGGSGGDGRSAGYYTASVAKGRDDYYTGKGEAPGEWFGAGSEALGLAGEIDADQFQTVVMGAVDPVSGQRLRRRARDRPVHGVDMTFSAPKSVSLVYFLGGRAGTGGGAPGPRRGRDGGVGLHGTTGVRGA